MVWRATPEEAKHTDGASRKVAMAKRIAAGTTVGLLGHLDEEPGSLDVSIRISYDQRNSMKDSIVRFHLLLVVFFCLPVFATAQTVQSHPATGTARMNAIAKGTFNVSLKPQPISDVASRAEIGRMSIDKQFFGDLVGTSKGEMFSAMGTVKGSAGYVAIERVSGTIGGRTGTFVLQHSGTMNRGAPTLTVAVVPDSGTEGFSGMSGNLTIDIVGGNHFYTLNYSLPE
jgi:hypothetical protein